MDSCIAMSRGELGPGFSINYTFVKALSNCEITIEGSIENVRQFISIHQPALTASVSTPFFSLLSWWWNKWGFHFLCFSYLVWFLYLVSCPAPAIKNINYDRLLKNQSAQKAFIWSLTVALLRSFAKSDDQYIAKPNALHGLTTGQYIRGKYDPRNVNPWCLSPPAVVFPGQYRRHRHSFEQTSFVSAVRRVGWLSSIICVKPQPLSTSAGQS